MLVLGESGTGKELVARYLHDASPRRAGPFVVVNCGAIPKELVESTLFGFEKGSFTGAATAQKGKFEQADRGTLFLDEFGELPLEQQVKLLRVLQDGVIERIGGAPRTVDVRIVAATNRDLGGMMADGKFREDLYYRVSGLEVTLPPLRERRDDIRAIAQAWLQRRALQLRLSREAERLLMSYNWPGNVRQLLKVLEVAVAFTNGDVITEAAVRQHSSFARTATKGPRRRSLESRARGLLARDGRLTAFALQQECGVSRLAAWRQLSALKRAGEIVARGRGRATHYIPVDGPK